MALESQGLTSVQCAGFVESSQTQKIASNFESLQIRSVTYKIAHAEKLQTAAVRIFTLFQGHLRTSETQSYFDFTLDQIGSQATRDAVISIIGKVGIREDIWENTDLVINPKDPWASFPNLERLPMVFDTKVPKKFYELGLGFKDIPQIMFEQTMGALPRNQVYGLNEIILKYEFYLSYMLKRLKGPGHSDGSLVSTALKELHDFSQRTYQNGAETLEAVNQGFSPMIFEVMEGLGRQKHSHYPFSHGRHEIMVTIVDKNPSTGSTIENGRPDGGTAEVLRVNAVFPSVPGTYRGELIRSFNAGFLIRLDSGETLSINTNHGAWPVMVALKPIFEE